MQFQLRWLDDLLSVCKEMDIGFSYWNYKNLDFGIISRGESLHSKLEQYNNPQRINYQLLSILQKYWYCIKSLHYWISQLIIWVASIQFVMQLKLHIQNGQRRFLTPFEMTDRRSRV